MERGLVQAGSIVVSMYDCHSAKISMRVYPIRFLNLIIPRAYPSCFQYIREWTVAIMDPRSAVREENQRELLRDTYISFLSQYIGSTNRVEPFYVPMTL